MERIVENLLKCSYKEPLFFLNFKKINRNFQVLNSPQTLVKKVSLTRWKIHDKCLSKPVINEGNINILFSGESYIILCKFSVQNKTNDADCLLFYWRGEQALKGYSPLPPGVDEYHPMDRFWQWCESAIFFNCFPCNLIVFSGPEDSFNREKLHLLIIRGELEGEIHLYEVPCEKRSLRRKTSFLLVYPDKKQFVYWHGLQTNKHHKDILKSLALHKILKNYEPAWEDFTVSEMHEKSETKWFLDIFQGNPSDYDSKHKIEFETKPRMFYLNSVTGDFAATEIEYPLRSENNNFAAYPFLQSHLLIPGLFLLDIIGSEIWLWIGEPKSDISVLNEFKKDLNLAEELVETYAKKRSNLLGIPVSVYHVRAGEEPLKFRNLFPTWN